MRIIVTSTPTYLLVLHGLNNSNKTFRIVLALSTCFGYCLVFRKKTSFFYFERLYCPNFNIRKLSSKKSHALLEVAELISDRTEIQIKTR
jgi:hypothetical protein